MPCYWAAEKEEILRMKRKRRQIDFKKALEEKHKKLTAKNKLLSSGMAAGDES